jgi:hypothetical protein
MLHGSEAVLPTDIDYGSPQVRAYTEEGNQAALEDAMDQLDESRDVTLHGYAKYQQALRRYHERNMRPASSTSGISYFDESKAARTGTSYRHLGRGRSSSTRCSNQGHTRSNTRTGVSSPTHGTSNTCVCFILD